MCYIRKTARVQIHITSSEKSVRDIIVGLPFTCSTSSNMAESATDIEERIFRSRPVSPCSSKLKGHKVGVLCGVKQFRADCKGRWRNL